MLTELHIENFAIIQKLDVNFTPGLITFTGETGAGKSIILDAIMAVIGGRADATSVRSGADRALVEATFKLPEGSRQAITAILEREDLLDDPNYLTLGRELRREGRSTGRINGRAASIPLMHEVGSYLVDTVNPSICRFSTCVLTSVCWTVLPKTTRCLPVTVKSIMSCKRCAGS